MTKPERLHHQVRQQMLQIIDATAAAVDISPTTVAIKTQDHYRNHADLEVHLEFASLEHFKQMARGLLANKHDPLVRLMDPNIDDASIDMFAEHLQERYPLPRRKGEPKRDPIYRRREAISFGDINVICDSFDRKAGALSKHGRALRAWNISRGGTDVAA